MGLRDKLRRLERATVEDMVTFELLDGSIVQFREDELFPEAFVFEFERGRRHSSGEDAGPPHPVIEALRQAEDGELARLISEHGTMVGILVAEDAIISGERERPGPPVVERSPGVFE